MNHNTSAQCHTENGEVFLTDQSGNGHHRKQNKMKNTLKPLPSFLSYTPRTDEVRHNVAELAMHARKLERELADLKAIHKTAIIDCQQYNPKRWKELCDVEEPAAIWLNGKQMTDLMKDKERLDWLIDNNCEIYEPDTALLYCDCDRESIDEMMAQATR